MIQEFFELSTILLVDDNADNLSVLSDFFNNSDYEVIVAKSGETAIQKAERELPDLILLDVLMPPGIDGFITCHRLKSNSITQDIPIIFMSALSEPVDKIKGLELGAVDYITKPFDRGEVLARVRTQLKIAKLSRMLKKQNTFLRWENQEKTLVEESLQKLNAQLEGRLNENTNKLYQAISELRRTEVALIQKDFDLCHSIFHDSLTNLCNRSWLVNRVGKIIHEQTNTSCVLLLIDIDRFMLINERYGHYIGDIFLKEFTKRLKSCLNNGASLVRFGGDEFAILLEKINNLDEAIAFVEKVQTHIELPYTINDYEISITVSIGVATGKPSHTAADAIIRDSEIAMSYAKTEGRGTYRFFDSNMHSIIYYNLRLEGELKQALGHEEFRIEYQPIVALDSSDIVGVEALLRWKNVIPNHFISIAEETGLINPIGWWVIEKSCQQLQIWQQKYPKYKDLSLNINFSIKQLKQDNILQRLEEILRKYSISPCALKIELTETCISNTCPSLLETLFYLKRMGIRLCIDDFGTGYSSLGRLQEFPIDVLKLDKCFVNHINSIPKNNPIVNSIVEIGHKLGIEIVAEGIETHEQLEQLKTLGCQYGQGYFFYKPMSVELVETLLANRS